jgi:hypothetical protein
MGPFTLSLRAWIGSGNSSDSLIVGQWHDPPSGAIVGGHRPLTVRGASVERGRLNSVSGSDRPLTVRAASVGVTAGLSLLAAAGPNLAILVLAGRFGPSATTDGQRTLRGRWAVSFEFTDLGSSGRSADGPVLA